MEGDRADRWRVARTFARLGLVTGTVLGVGLAFGAGGPDGYIVPLSGLLSFPTGIFLGLLPRLDVASTGSHAVWGVSHLLPCASIAANYALVGAGIDLLRRKLRGSPSPTMPPPVPSPGAVASADDCYLLAAHAEVDALLQGDLRTPELASDPMRSSPR